MDQEYYKYEKYKKKYLELKKNKLSGGADKVYVHYENNEGVIKNLDGSVQKCKYYDDIQDVIKGKAPKYYTCEKDIGTIYNCTENNSADNVKRAALCDESFKEKIGKKSFFYRLKDGLNNIELFLNKYNYKNIEETEEKLSAPNKKNIIYYIKTILNGPTDQKTFIDYLIDLKKNEDRKETLTVKEFLHEFINLSYNLKNLKNIIKNIGEPNMYFHFNEMKNNNEKKKLAKIYFGEYKFSKGSGDEDIVDGYIERTEQTLDDITTFIIYIGFDRQKEYFYEIHNNDKITTEQKIKSYARHDIPDYTNYEEKDNKDTNGFCFKFHNHIIFNYEHNIKLIKEHFEIFKQILSDYEKYV